MAHKRPSAQTSSHQLLMMGYLRFIYAGDLAGAWGRFGGLSGQLAHLGILMAISLTDAVMVAMSYDKTVRSTVEVNSRGRLTEDQRDKMIGMLTADHGPSMQMVLIGLAVPIPTGGTALGQQVKKNYVKLGWPPRIKGDGKRTHKGDNGKGETDTIGKVGANIGAKRAVEKEKGGGGTETIGGRISGANSVLTGTNSVTTGASAERMIGRMRDRTSRTRTIPKTPTRTG